MRVILFLAVVTLIIVTAAFSGDKGNVARSFSDQDLDMYKSDPDKSAAKDAAPAEIPDEFSDEQAIGQENAQSFKKYEIPYIAYEGTARRIIVPVTFNNRFTAHMLLDTGAPGMHISLRLAQELGILENDEAKLNILVSGVGGSVPAIYTIIDTIRIGGAESSFIPTTISSAISNHFEGLIGMDFMANYSVEIDTKRHVLILKELPERPDMPGGHDEEWWRLTFRRFNSMRSRWVQYRKGLNRIDTTFSGNRQIIDFAEKQYDEADALLSRLNVFASENSVPLEWR